MKYLAGFLLALSLLAPLAALAGQDVSYYDGDTELEGYWADSACARDETLPRPTVLIIHQWKGLGDYEKSRADMLAAQCYNAFAVDMYGKGIRPKNTDEAAAQSGLYKNDPALARKRIIAALDFARAHQGVDSARIAAIGYCFGGGMALELARSGADIKGVVTFHGSLASKDPLTRPGIIKASVQAHHGADDPYVTQAEVKTFEDEMNAAGADWSLTQYAHAVHSFTEKEAGNDPSKGVAYNEKADIRSWTAALAFLHEVLTPPAP